MKSWGWGSEEVSFGLRKKPKALQFLNHHLGLRSEDLGLKERFEVQIQPSRLDHLSGPKVSGLHLGHSERVLNSLGKSYPDLLRMRAGRIEKSVDGVVFPSTREELQEVVTWALERDLCLIPFGGGTSVVGGLEPTLGSKKAVVSLDLSKLNRLLEFDPISQLAKFECGVLGPRLESELRQRGYTLGHFPQSFEFSTLGGWLAARSSGQNSLRYGGIEKLCVGIDLLSPQGRWSVEALPRRATGPDFKEIAIGSEGHLGVIESATVKITPQPQHKIYELYFFKTFEQAVTAVRSAFQGGLTAAMIRVSDEEETEASLKLGGSDAHGWSGLFETWISKSIQMGLKWRGFSLPRVSAVWVGFEGDRDSVELQSHLFRIALRDQGGICMGEAPGKKWLQDRFKLPYLRDDLMDLGCLVETFETSTEWSNVFHLHHEVQKTVRAVCDGWEKRSLVLCHLSHLYPTGSSLYFTVVTPQIGPGNTSGLQRNLDQWRELKKIATETILKNGGALSHHHGVGVDHAPYFAQSPLQRRVLQGLKESFDPSGIFQAGKWNLERSNHGSQST